MRSSALLRRARLAVCLPLVFTACLDAETADDGALVLASTESALTTTTLFTSTSLAKGASRTGSYTATAAGRLTFKTTGSGDADLYIKKGVSASRSTFDCKSDGGTATEQCGLNVATGDRVYYLVYAYSASTVALTLDIATNTPPPPITTTTTTLVPSTSLALGASRSGTFTVPAAGQVTFRTTGTGDVDLYVKNGSAASKTNYTCKSDGTTSTETCTLTAAANAKLGYYLYAYKASTAALTVTAPTAATPTYCTANDSDGTCLPAPTCRPVYGQANLTNDPTRFNIVFVGVGFASATELRDSARRIVDRDGTTFAQSGAYGMMQVPAYAEANARFNTWYVNRVQAFTPGVPVASQLYRNEWVTECQQGLPNRVIPVFIYPRVAGTDLPYGSYGRSYVTVADCLSTGNTCTAAERLSYQQSNVHEMQHTMPCLLDEYGSVGNSNANALPFSGALPAGNGSSQFWVGTSYSTCLAQAPWRARIGDGCGTAGVVDCFKPECTQPIRFANGIDMNTDCCLPGTNCWAEIGCFEGGLGKDTSIWRSTAGSVLRNPYYDQFTAAALLNGPAQDVIRRVIAKGPAVGRTWLPSTDYQLDCDASSTAFVP